LRQLKSSPSFALMVVLTLALGIGATTAIFSLIEGILLRPLPFHDPDRLVQLGDHLEGGFGATPVTAREIGTYSTATSAFSSVGGYIAIDYELSGDAPPIQVPAARFTAGVFPTLGVSPLLGRVFTQEEEAARQPLAVISHALWLNRFQGDPQILGRSIVLDRKVYSIIGVMPRSFAFPIGYGPLDQAKLWVSMSLTADELSDQHAGFWGYQIVARLKDGVSLAQAAQDAERVAKQITSDFPTSVTAVHIRGHVTQLREYAVSDSRPLLRSLFVAVLVLLLIACVNVAGLLLVRAIRRRREYAMRLALGASSAAVVRESVFEGLLLGLSGGVLGLLFAATVVRTTLHLLPDSIPRVDSITMDATVLAFGFLLALATGALCSLAPAFAALKTNLTESLKENVPSASRSSNHSWLRSTLVVSEIAIALVLLTVCGAFLRSIQKMHAVDPGFRPDHVIAGSYQLPLTQYSTVASAGLFHRAVIDRLSAKPGITAAGISSVLPASGLSPESAYTLEGEPTADWKLKFAMFGSTDGDYFRTMGIPLLDGRYFTAADGPNSPLVVIVNKSMAEHSWPNQRAIGKRMHAGTPKKGLPWATVVGVVADTKLGSRDEGSIDQWYLPSQQPAILYGADSTGNLTDPAAGYITLRSPLPSDQTARTLRSTIAEIDPLLALQQIQTMSDVISAVESPRRFNTDLITAFSISALLLAVTGIYTVVAFSVSLRTHELAIRMALGARRIEIVRLVLISGARLTLLGCALGVVGSLAASRFVRASLFEVSPTDPLIYVSSVLLMMFTALLASAVPATRAASANPMKALRST
jgi:putative ABC transport system permease protein